MWIMLRDAFVSIVDKDCGPHELLVRARRPGDIERIFGEDRDVSVSRDSDYMYRAKIHVEDVVTAIENEICNIDYGNFKNAVTDKDLHDAYLKVWSAMAATQPLPPYSEPYRTARPKKRRRHGGGG